MKLIKRVTEHEEIPFGWAYAGMDLHTTATKFSEAMIGGDGISVYYYIAPLPLNFILLFLTRLAKQLRLFDKDIEDMVHSAWAQGFNHGAEVKEAELTKESEKA